jgi:hypothetical protein
MRYKLIFYLCITAVLLPDISVAAPFFRETGVINIPSAYTVPQGIFSAGINTAIHEQRREELALRVDFGIFNLLELGFITLKNEDKDYLLGNIKLMLSRESGSLPGLSVGIDNFGEKVDNSLTGYRRSIYGVVSKKFNLPLVHIINGHIGIGNNRYVSDESIGKYLHGVFLGLNKDLYLSFLESYLILMCEVDGKDINAGVKYSMDSGLALNVAVGEINGGSEEIKYYIGLSFTNAKIMEKIGQSSELAKRAVRIANEASSKK